MIYKAFQDLQLSQLGFGTMRLPLREDKSIDEELAAAMTDAPLQPFLKLSSFKTNCFITKPFAAIINQWTSSNRRF